MNLPELRRRTNALLTDYRHALKTIKAEKAALVVAKETTADLEQARAVLQAVAEAVQRQAHQRIAGIVSRCLSAVFGEDAYVFQIDFVQKRGKTEAVLQLVRDGLAIDPLDAAGGGVIDCVSFALRISCLTMQRPPFRKLLVLDEPWKHLSSAYRPAMRALVEILSAELGIQFLLVTHSREFMIGKLIEIR